MQNELEWRVAKADFKDSVFDIKRANLPYLPEVAFVGRSNVGKSSLLNALVSRKSLAKTSKTPGRTQSLNFFEIVFRSQVGDRSAYFVDLPGFGYAKVNQEIQGNWQNLCASYLFKRSALKLVALLVDCRRGLGLEERWVYELLPRSKCLVVLTKGDKVSKSKLAQTSAQVASELGIGEQGILCVSTLSKSVFGVQELHQRVLASLDFR